MAPGFVQFLPGSPVRQANRRQSRCPSAVVADHTVSLRLNASSPAPVKFPTVMVAPSALVVQVKPGRSRADSPRTTEA